MGNVETLNPRPAKVAVVDEVKQKMSEAQAILVTEYRGLSVGALAKLRRELRASGAEYKVYKNTLVRLAANESGLGDLSSVLTGPVGLTFVTGDIAGAAKALREMSKTNALLVLKGGSLGKKMLVEKDVQALADLPSRDVLLAQIAGAFQAPLVKTAGLLQALPRNFAYGLKALIEQKSAA
jgi:large subunit ribosomal protein L10